MAALAGTARLLDDLPVPVALVDPDGAIRYVNAAAVARFGADLVGRPAGVLGDVQSAPFHDEDGSVVGSLVVSVDAPGAADRLSRLQVVTSKLGGARTVDEVALIVADHAAAGVGAQSGAFMQLVDDGATFVLVREVGLAPSVADAFHRFPADAPLPAGDAVRTRSIVVITDEADRDARYPTLVGQPMIRQTYALVPVLTEDRAFGALSFGFLRPHEIGAEDRRFLLAVASQAATALDRIRVEEQERLARRRQELLARTSGVLAGLLEPSASAAAVGRLLVQDLADTCTVQLEGETIAAVANDPIIEELLNAVRATPANDLLADHLVQLVEPGRSLLEAEIDPASWDELLGDEEAAAAVRAIGVASAIVVGLHSGGRRLGVLALTRRPDRDPFDQDAFVLVSELAGRMASAFDNALAHRARADVARTLQASLLPPSLPSIPGIRLASRYEPAGDGSLVGGDFYDVFPMEGGRWGLVLGDVCGQGVPAAALTALVRWTVRAAARMWTSPAEILRFTNDAILDHDTGERFCTLLVVVLRPNDGGVTATLAAGGHHLPLHRRPGGEAVPVGRVGTALGLVRGLDVFDATVTLASGDVLVLTTDGVIEARDAEGHQVADGFLESLVESHADDGADAVAAAVERAVLAIGGGRAGDDVAMLVVEVTGDAPAPVGVEDARVGPFDERYPTEKASVTEARRAVAAWLDRQGIRGSRVPDLLLALTELCTNAVRSANTAVEVRAWLTTDAVMFEVTDDGPGFDPNVPRSPRDIDPLAERGRGLFLVAALVDEATIESGPHGTIVRCFVAR